MAKAPGEKIEVNLPIICGVSLWCISRPCKYLSQFSPRRYLCTLTSATYLSVRAQPKPCSKARPRPAKQESTQHIRLATKPRRVTVALARHHDTCLNRPHCDSRSSRPVVGPVEGLPARAQVQTSKPRLPGAVSESKNPGNRRVPRPCSRD